MGKHKIRTTINPREVLEVDDAEFLDLTRQGLIKSEEDDKKAVKADDKKGS